MPRGPSVTGGSLETGVVGSMISMLAYLVILAPR
jgi:hypothetical protein